ncbi:glycosyltransferase family 2 protein [Pseudorhizobium pelagicum]|uniref:Glycosyl transferase n=1 Tax=Pseudorhizobium pelagicum TaxID=1509405 RepID=A0A922NY22_9HYPH|nr:glycosyltransferase family 2 protein [Pseudorhizobium pelagicum]KEQ02993.1 glycosyl transferase [Pseudorhizobium pelagicum]KEQ08339.1 glycosyl transferase [Pseudorhizobium pelagicum]
MRLGEYPQAAGSPDGAGELRPRAVTANGLDRSRLASVGDESAALQSLGFSKPLIERLSKRARQNNTTLETELLHHPGIQEDAYYGAMARFLRLPFADRIDAGTVVDTTHLDTQLRRPAMVRLQHARTAPQVAIVPEAGRLAGLAAALINLPMLGRDLTITTPSAIRKAVWAAGATRRVRETVATLSEDRPQFSARTVVTGSQGFAAGMIVAPFLIALLAAPALILPVLHPVMSYLYLAALGLRILALIHRKHERHFEPPPTPGPLPTYTVLVALYREAAVAAQLVACLKRLDWPVSLLDIKLVCEADDAETLETLRAMALPRHFEIVEVPAAHPRTKPKALSYALAGVRGDYLVIYDAEDRPHPGQLREAHGRFSSLPPDLACLQAPLVIANGSSSWISALFALEYAALFRGLLPMLAHYGLPMPLGGTSNHFRTALLRQAGGWDPFNVTEDADLGLRLFRLGYRSAVLRRQTLEDAPVRLSIWMGQRTRWFKGWVQTWLVLMRRPKRLLGEMGLRGWLIFHLMIGGMLLSSLLHPLIFVFLAQGALAMMAVPTSGIPAGVLVLFCVDAFNIFGSYLTFVALGISSMTDHEKRLVGGRWMAVPLYWMMTSLAAWRAILELRSRPFFWQKTPHEPAQ